MKITVLIIHKKSYFMKIFLKRNKNINNIIKFDKNFIIYINNI